MAADAAKPARLNAHSLAGRGRLLDMQSEDTVPQSKRYLWLHGFLSAVGLDFARAGLPRAWPTTVRALFVGYAHADLPLGKTFTLAFPYGKPHLAVPTCAVIHAGTQQVAKPLREIPRGWKTICLIDFPDGVPDVVAALPTQEGWVSRLEDCVCLSNPDAVAAMLAESALPANRA